MVQERGVLCKQEISVVPKFAYWSVRQRRLTYSAIRRNRTTVSGRPYEDLSTIEISGRWSSERSRICL